MSSRRRRTSRTVSRDALELAIATPEVVARRVTQMWLAGNNPTPRDRREFHRMSAEKVAAFHESWNAMFLELCRANLELAASSTWWPWWVATSKPGPAHLRMQSQAIAGVIGAGLVPIRRRAVANVKRLRRARR